MFKQCISIGCTVRTHFYYVPVLFYVRIPTVFQHLPAYISTMFKHFLCAFLLFPSTFCRAHSYCIPALGACISTPIQHFMRAFLLHFYCISIAIQHFSMCAFQHFSIAFLLQSSTFLHREAHHSIMQCLVKFCVHFFCVHFYCVPTLFVCDLYYDPALFLCVYVCVCMYVYVCVWVTV